MPGREMMVVVVDKSDKDEFETEVNTMMENGYKLSSSDCGYIGEVGNSVYDCNYYMAIMVLD